MTRCPGERDLYVHAIMSRTVFLNIFLVNLLTTALMSCEVYTLFRSPIFQLIIWIQINMVQYILIEM